MEFACSERNFEFTAKYHEDCGLAAVNGKTVTVSAVDVTLLQSRMIGGVIGEETIDSCELSVSSDTAVLIRDSMRIGGRSPKTGLSLTTHSGSVWEVRCESLCLRVH